MYDDKNHLGTFNEENLSEYLLQAQWAEMVELKKALCEINDRAQSKLESKLDILDIGIGNGRIPKHLSGIEEIWDDVHSYEGIDIAQNCVDLSTRVARENGIEDKVRIRLLNATDIDKLDGEYEVILSTWFTAGNFYPEEFSFSSFRQGYDLSSNRKFEMIFRKAYDKLRVGGEIIIGSIYLDNGMTRLRQEDAYKHFGWTIITDERDSFTASKEGWWSQRFSEEQIYNYLRFVPRENISLIPLDTYDFAMMIRIRK